MTVYCAILPTLDHHAREIFFIYFAHKPRRPFGGMLLTPDQYEMSDIYKRFHAVNFVLMIAIQFRTWFSERRTCGH
jgi:hypothetical protein